MATTLYFPQNNENPLTGGGYYYGGTYEGRLLGLDPPQNTNSSLGDAFFVPAGGTESANSIKWVSPPIASAVTLSSSVTVYVAAYEDNATDNVCFKVKIHKRVPSGTLTQIGSGTCASEAPISLTTQSVTVTPTSTSFAVGDRIVIELLGANFGTVPAGGANLRMIWGTTYGVYSQRIDFTDTISFSGPSSTEYGYAVSGSDAVQSVGLWNQRVDKLQFYTLSQSVLGGSYAARTMGSSFASSTKGYYTGMSNIGPSYSPTIYSILFSTDTNGSITAALSSYQHKNSCGGNSSSSGYVFSGYDTSSYTYKVFRVAFADEATAITSEGMLSLARQSSQSASTPDAAHIYGGRNGTTAFVPSDYLLNPINERYDFNTNTSAYTHTVFSKGKCDGAALVNSTYTSTYLLSGEDQSNSLVSEIERHDLLTDTISTISARVPSSGAYYDFLSPPYGSGSKFGFTGYGEGPNSQKRLFEFSTETLLAIGWVYSSVSSYKYGAEGFTNYPVPASSSTARYGGGTINTVVSMSQSATATLHATGSFAAQTVSQSSSITGTVSNYPPSWAHDVQVQVEDFTSTAAATVLVSGTGANTTESPTIIEVYGRHAYLSGRGFHVSDVFSQLDFGTDTVSKFSGTLSTATMSNLGTGISGKEYMYVFGYTNTLSRKISFHTSTISVAYPLLPNTETRTQAGIESANLEVGYVPLDDYNAAPLRKTLGRLDMLTETMSVHSNQLGTYGAARGTVKSSTAAYFCGGKTGTSTYSTEIESLIFADETIGNPSAVLSETNSSQARSYSSTKGYLYAGYGGANRSTLGAITFSTEAYATISTIAAVNGLVWTSMVRPSTCGYAAYSNYSSGSIYKLTHSSETAAVVSGVYFVSDASFAKPGGQSDDVVVGRKFAVATGVPSMSTSGEGVLTGDPDIQAMGWQSPVTFTSAGTGSTTSYGTSSTTTAATSSGAGSVLVTGTSSKTVSNVICTSGTGTTNVNGYRAGTGENTVAWSSACAAGARVTGTSSTSHATTTACVGDRSDPTGTGANTLQAFTSWASNGGARTGTGISLTKPVSMTSYGFQSRTAFGTSYKYLNRIYSPAEGTVGHGATGANTVTVTSAGVGARNWKGTQYTALSDFTSAGVGIHTFVGVGANTVTTTNTCTATRSVSMSGSAEVSVSSTAYGKNISFGSATAAVLTTTICAATAPAKGTAVTVINLTGAATGRAAGQAAGQASVSTTSSCAGQVKVFGTAGVTSAVTSVSVGQALIQSTSNQIYLTGSAGFGSVLVSGSVTSLFSTLTDTSGRVTDSPLLDKDDMAASVSVTLIPDWIDIQAEYSDLTVVAKP